MGIGAKIKEALHGDHHDQSTDDVKAPGAYPDDVPSQKHSTGKDYNTHGDLINKKWETTGPAGTSDPTHTGTGTGTGNTGATGHGGNPLSSSGSTRNRLHRDTDEYHPTQEAYSQPTHGHQTRDSGVGLGHHNSTKDGASQGAYWGDLSSEGHQGQGLGNTDNYPDRTHRGQGLTGAGRDGHNPRFEDQAVGGGVYNSATGTGSPDYTGSHGKHHTSGGTVHDPLTSSTKGTNIPSGNTYDQNTDRHGHGGHGAPTSRNDHIGGGLAGAGAGAAAGYGANEYAHRGHDNTGYNSSHHTGGRDSHAPGVPQSSMLDPEPRLPSSATHQGHQAPGTYSPTQHNSGNISSAASGLPNLATHQGHQAPGAYSPTQHNPGNNTSSAASGLPNSAVHQDHQVSGAYSPTQHNLGNTSSATSGTGLGKDHYGPAHEGAKVLHTCQHCGQDNDISQYFKKEAVYRLGA